jgi:phage tail sheath protein FI
MPETVHPGVYIQELDSRVRVISGVRKRTSRGLRTGQTHARAASPCESDTQAARRGARAA